MIPSWQCLRVVALSVFRDWAANVSWVSFGGRNVASTRASIRDQNHAQHGRLIPLQICRQVSPDEEKLAYQTRDLFSFQTIDCTFVWVGGIKKFHGGFQSNPAEMEMVTDRIGMEFVCIFFRMHSRRTVYTSMVRP